MTTKYETDVIYGWNGGDCPVHPETEVKFWTNSGGVSPVKAKCLRWKRTDEGLGDIIAFQVVKQHVEPKVIWVNETKGVVYEAYLSEEAARRTVYFSTSRIAVKYVEVEKELNTCRMAQAVMDNTVADLESKLAKAVKALQWCAMYEDGDKARATLAEIKGESHE